MSGPDGIGRRAFLAALGAAGAAVAGAAALLREDRDPGAGRAFPVQGAGTLRERAAARGLLYGAAIDSSQLRDAGFAALFARECGVLVPGTELKWLALRPAPGSYDFRGADALLGFAGAAGLQVRGHTLVWHQALPAWFAPTSASGAERMLREHVETVAGRYAGRLHSWDVVNEVVEPAHGRADALRDSPWLRLLGPGYIATAFHLAAAADPKARLVLNENWLELDHPDSERKRRAVLRLLDRLVAASVPVHALGVQCHLRAERAAGGPGRLRAFLGEVAALGLEILVTELDVADAALPADVAVRDRAVAAVYEDYLAAVLDERAVTGVVTWGLSDRYTWLTGHAPHPAGVPVRPLPFDRELRPKPAWNALARAFAAAPRR